MADLSWVNFGILVMASFWMANLIKIPITDLYLKKSHVTITVFCSMIAVCIMWLLPVAFPVILALAVAGTIEAIFTTSKTIKICIQNQTTVDTNHETLYQNINNQFRSYQEKAEKYEQAVEECRRTVDKLSQQVNSCQEEISNSKQPSGEEKLDKKIFENPNEVLKAAERDDTHISHFLRSYLNQSND